MSHGGLVDARATKRRGAARARRARVMSRGVELEWETKTMTAKYYDWFERKTLDRPNTKLTAGQYIRQQPHRELIADLIERHIENYMEAIPRLYAMLLIKTLCQSDPELMIEFGERVVQLDANRIKSGRLKSG